jgi:uncharacterized phage-associated protein
MKLQKLCYYAQAHYLAIYDKPLFKDPIKAWNYGAVIPDLYKQFKKFKNNIIKQDVTIDEYAYTAEQHLILGYVYRDLGKYTATELSRMCHREAPWKNHAKNSSTIKHEELKLYFRKHSKLTISLEDEEDDEDFILAFNEALKIKLGKSKTYTTKEVEQELGLGS